MSDFNAQLERMKALFTYGTVNEDTKQSNYTLEYHKTGADGVEYGIIKEFNHYYIKSNTSKGKEELAESYNYIGGWANKKRYEYDSYSNALKNFEMKLDSVNEACDAKVDIATLDPFKKQDVIAEGTEKMRDEIARQRQIMYNAAMIMNESADYAVKGGKACSTSQPEAETGAKGDKIEGSKDAKAEPEYKGSHVGLDKKAEPFKENPSASKDLKESCEGGSCDTDFDEGMDKGRDPKEIGWDMEDQQKVNEGDEKEWDEGLPGSAGTGEADTDHNNDPFNKSIKESSCCEDDDVISDEDVEISDDDDDFEFSEEDFLDDDDVVADDEDVVDGEDDFASAEEGEDFPSVEDGEDLGAELGDDEESEEPESGNDLEAKIAELEAKVAELEAKLGEGEEDIDEPVNDELDSEDADFEEEDFESEDELGGENIDDEQEPFEESKRRYMNTIVESVVRDLLKEDELHDFGKHPGYRKKPMELPQTGEDKNQHGEDWNDESAHSEEPFGKQIGDGSPFNQLVDKVTKDVMYQMKKGVSIEGENKKKED